MPPKPALLQLERIDLRLAGRWVLRGVDFALARGEMLGLLGVNGAGKSTTLALIAGVLAPAAGRILLDGADITDAPDARRAHVGWVPESVPLWPEFTVHEALDASARLRGMPAPARKAATERELARLELTGIARRLCGQLSLGQKRRVGLAQALLHEPSVLVLDEPGNGLDPLQTAQLRALLKTLAPTRGIILSSHVLAEVEATCDRVVMLHAGQVRDDAPLDGQPGRLDARFRNVTAAAAKAAA